MSGPCVASDCTDRMRVCSVALCCAPPPQISHTDTREHAHDFQAPFQLSFCEITAGSRISRMSHARSPSGNSIDKWGASICWEQNRAAVITSFNPLFFLCFLREKQQWRCRRRPISLSDTTCVCVFLPLAERPDKRAWLRDPGDDEDEAGCRETETHRTNAERRWRGRRGVAYSCEALVS